MFDYKYYYLRFFQKLINFSNYIQRKLIPNTIINLLGQEKFLILKLDRIGDAVWTIYFIKILKKNYPNLQIHIVANNYNKFVFEKYYTLIDKIYFLDENPPNYLLKFFYKNIFFVLEIFITYFKYKKFWIKLVSNKYDYCLNLTGWKYFEVAKLFPNNIGGGLGIFNYLYKYPIIQHNEIGSRIHIIQKRLNIFGISNGNLIKSNLLGIYNGKNINNKNNKNILLFLGGKNPNKLYLEIYQKIIIELNKYFLNINTISDTRDIKADFYLEKRSTGFYVQHDKFENILRKFNYFFGVDGGVLHYASMFIRTISIYSSSNIYSAYPFDGKLIFQQIINNWKIFQTEHKRHLIISQNLPCTGCFQIGCQTKKCLNLLDIEIEIIINAINNLIFK